MEQIIMFSLQISGNWIEGPGISRNSQSCGITEVVSNLTYWALKIQDIEILCVSLYDHITKG